MPQTPLAAPQLNQPADKAASIPEPVSFQWSPVGNATGYEFILAKDSQLKQVVTDIKTQGNEYRYTAPLEKGTYYWQVKALGKGTGQPSQVSSFSIGQPAAATPVEKPAGSGIPIWLYIGLAVIIVVLIVLIVLFSRKRPF